MVNRVILIGRLGQDPEVRRLESGAVVAKFSVATNENYKDKTGEWQQTTEWHDVVVWRALAERAESGLKKGASIYVEGKLTHRKWQDSEGNPRKTTEVVGSYFRIIDKGGSGNSNYEKTPFPAEENAPTTSTPPSTPAVKATSGDAPAEDDLPF